MPKANPRLEAARKAYREALEAARESPTAEAWPACSQQARSSPRPRTEPRTAAEPARVGQARRGAPGSTPSAVDVANLARARGESTARSATSSASSPAGRTGRGPRGR